MEIWSKCDICGRDIPVGELCYGLKKGNCICKDCCTGFENCTFTLAPAPTLTPPNEWVNVEERLPERGKDVLLYFGEESRISVGGRYDVGDGWYAVIVNEYETICDTSPRSWMPLPAAPNRRPPEGEA